MAGSYPSVWCRSILGRCRRSIRFAFALVLPQIADLSSLFSSSKLLFDMDFERPSSGVHQDLVNVLGMVLAVFNRCSSVVVNRCSHVDLDQLQCFVVDRCCPF